MSPLLKMNNPFPGFEVSRPVVDESDIIAVRNAGLSHPEFPSAATFLCMGVIDDNEQGKIVDQETKKEGDCIILPRSLDGKTIVLWEGMGPQFTGVNDRGLVVILPANCVLRVEFVGDKGTHARYFSTL